MRLPRPHRHDVLIAVAGLLGGLILYAIGVHTTPSRLLPDRAVLVPLVVMAALELLRRTRPQFALVMAVLTLTADQFTSGSLATIVMFTDIIYAAVVYGTPRSARRIPVTAALITVVGTIGFLVWFRKPEAIVFGILIGLVGYAPAATGAIVRNHRDAAETARLRAEQTALLAEMDRVQAVTAERSRMARELHDMVANHLSAIAIHSTAALSLDDAKTTRDALTVIRENSVDGLAEMRRLIGLLRDADIDNDISAPTAAPTLDGLGTLLDQARANGLDVTLDDARPDHAGDLPAPVDLAAYRIVQESLTNALKHAAPGPVRVALHQDPDTLDVTVSSPYGELTGPRAPGSGAGLVGMRERATLLGGNFAAGPHTTENGPCWRVHAELPIVRGGTEQ
ncbi:sensor histidine kinase [Streptomyces sp. NPDC002851]